MASAEHQQLVELLEHQAEEAGRRFTEIERRFYRRFERLEQEYQAITQRLRLEQRLGLQ